jgi:hypothetical protein
METLYLTPFIMTVPAFVPCTFPAAFSIFNANEAFTLLNVLNLALTASSTFLASGSLLPIALGACAAAARQEIINVKAIDNMRLNMIVVVWLRLANGQSRCKEKTIPLILKTVQVHTQF